MHSAAMQALRRIAAGVDEESLPFVSAIFDHTVEWSPEFSAPVRVQVLLGNLCATIPPRTCG